MRRIEAGELERWVRDLLAAAGLQDGAAAAVADSLVDASLRGVDSHGVARTTVYVDRLRAGGITADPHPKVLRREGAMALVHGDDGPGQVAGIFATDLSIELAREFGVGAVAVRRSSHYGAAAYYTRRAAAAGLVGMSSTNSDPLVIPYGGMGRALGTNPISLAAPLPGGGIFDLDMASSQVAINKIYNARDEGRAIPEGWGVDEQGRSTTDPALVHSGVPLGGYKGYALAVLVEILCGILPGAGITHGVGALYGDPAAAQDVGHFHLAMDPERTVGRDRFATLLAGLLEELVRVPVAPGHDEVLAPGDPEKRARAERSRDGIPLEPALLASLEAKSAELGVTVPTG
jgi:ureidoglycolate dehydrogenase (NAD+)